MNAGAFLPIFCKNRAVVLQLQIIISTATTTLLSGGVASSLTIGVTALIDLR